MNNIKIKKPVMLIVMDGFGLSPDTRGNAIAAAQKPNLDYLLATYPNTTLNVSGEAVGLPAGQMGNSEVGHLNLGAGRIVYQSFTRVSIAVRDEALDRVPAIDNAINQAIKNKSKLHIMGLLSDGGVHSHIDHIIYLLRKSVKRGVQEVCVHAFLDGRDVPPQSAKNYLRQLDEAIKSTGNSKIGIISGRYYAMDRDKNWNRIKLAYDALVYNQAPKKGMLKGIDESYEHGVTDEFVVPYIVSDESNINDGDSVIFANFRPDRAIQISMALTNPDLVPIDNLKRFSNLTYVSMMLYSENVKGDIAFELQELNNTYGEVISRYGLKQLRIAETEKYAHVTYFFDGGTEKNLPGATRILIPSPKVATYDLQPEMSAALVTKRVLAEIASGRYDTIILNFANCDMVGHTAVFDATVKAVETVDECVGKIYQKIKEVGGILLITADHGNAEQLLDEKDKPFSAHTTNPVPLIITEKDFKLRNEGNLGDIAPTMLELLGITQPKEMTGKSIIIK
ncbi:MAG: 2,3-bisphosphoglycerate-independent phosphoglycerate mutase [Bacilli bacterium]|nr:2,3-bisphosphoglycerate-independent phosphoglycerate mutase [Bacilli bacterium]